MTKSLTKLRRWAPYAPLLLAAIGIAWGLDQWAASILKNRMAAMASAVAAALPPDAFAGLEGRAGDEENPSYTALQGALLKVRDSEPGIRNAYVYAIRNGREINLVSTPALPGTPEIRPGTDFGPVDAEEEAWLGRGGGFIFTPYTDAWGTWITAVAPALRDPASGRVSAAFGFDIAYSSWQARIDLLGLFALAVMVLGGLIVRWVARLEDGKRRAEAERLDSARIRQAAEAERVRSERELLARLSHQVRNPLSAVVGFARLLSESETDGERGAQLELLRSSSAHLLDLVNGILDLSRLDAGLLELKVAPFSPRSLSRSAMAPFRAQAEEKGLEFRFEAGEGLPDWLLGDEARIRQILVNLLSNAVKFCETGMVVLRLSRRGATDDASQLVIEVADTGRGMDADFLARLFERGEEGVGTVGGGSGLGLAIAKRLALAMGGDIEAGSGRGRGSEFRLRLPLRECVAPPAGMPEAPVDLHGLHVLVADDDRANRALAAAVLGKSGATIVQAEDGETALILLLSGGISAGVLDHHMSRLDGEEVALMLRSFEEATGRPRTVLISLSASLYGDGDHVTTAVPEAATGGDHPRGAFDFVLRKPFDPPVLAMAVAGARGRGKAHPPASAPGSPHGGQGEVPARDTPGVDREALSRATGGEAELGLEILRSYAEARRALFTAAGSSLAAGDARSLGDVVRRLRESATEAGAAGPAWLAVKAEEACATAGESIARSAIIQLLRGLSEA